MNYDILEHSYLSKNGYVIKKDLLPNNELVILKKELVGRPLVDEKYNFDQNSNIFKLYTETKTKIYIPKIYGINRYGIPNKKLENYTGKKWESDVEFVGTLYPTQKEASDVLLKELLENSGGGILSIFTGGGKTFTAIYVLSKLKGKTLIIVNKITLMKQWENEIKMCLPGISIGIIQGKKIDVEGRDIVIGMLQSLSLIDYHESVFNDINTVVIDECFPYDTCIITSDGNINIGQLYYMKERNETLPMVKTFNENTKKFEYKKILNVFRKQNDNLIEIICSKMKITSTENHRYLTHKGWKEANNLDINDYIISNYDKNTINTVCPGLNCDQYQIVLGSFLGDGNIQTLKNGRYRLNMTHCKDQYEYCKWKAYMFNVNDIRYIEKNGYSQKEAYQFSTKTFYLFNSLPITKTYVPQWILDDLDEKGLAIWFMDDGSINKKSFNSTINTDSFDEDSQKRMVLKLKEMNIDCKYINYKKSYYRIVINKNGTKELIKMISKYMHNNMLYKLLTRQYINYIQDMSIKILDENTIFCSRENIKKEFLIENYIYKIYKNYNKNNNEINYVKYIYCNKCNNMTLHGRNIQKNEYWNCNHTYKHILKNLPIKFGEYNWDNKFLNYGYSKITKINKNIKNYNKSKYKRNYVFDIEVEDNHNYIVKKRSHGYIQNGFVVHNCHNVPSKVFSKVLMKTGSQYTIGLSATPKRGDGCEYVFKYFIGDIVYQCKSNREGLSPKINYINIKSKEYKEIKIENRFTGGTSIQFASMISELIDMPKRNKLIIEVIKHYITEKRKILVLSDRREHLKNIQKLLDNDPTVFFTYGLFVGQMKYGDLEKSKASSVILATYSAFGEGISEKDLDTLFLITPKKYIGHLQNTSKNESGKLEQIVGRIFRKDHIEKNPLIIDIQDDFSIYKVQSNSRKIFYNDHFKKRIVIEQSIDLDKYIINDVDISKLITKENIKLLGNSECIIED